MPRFTTPLFTASASVSYPGETYGTTVDTLSRGSVSWEDRTARYHVWVRREPEVGATWELDISGMGVIYKNPLYSVRRGDPGFYKTRYLDHRKVGNVAVVEAALAFARTGALEISAQRQITEGRAKIAVEEKAEADHVKACFFKAIDESASAGELPPTRAKEIRNLAAYLSDTSWRTLGKAVRK